MLGLYLYIQSSAESLASRIGQFAASRKKISEAGQASAEYALVLLGAAAVALLVVAWATKTNRVGRLLDSVFDRLLGSARPETN